MKPLKTPNALKATTKCSFLPPGTLGKERDRGRISLTPEKAHLQTSLVIPPSTDVVKQYLQTMETSDTGKAERQGFPSSGALGLSQNEMGSFHRSSFHDTQLVFKKENMESATRKRQRQGLENANTFGQSGDEEESFDNNFFHDTQLVFEKEYMQTRALGKGRGRSLRSLSSSKVVFNEAGNFHHDSQYTNEKMPSSPNNTRSNASMTFGQGMNTRNSAFFLEKENMHSNIDFTSSREYVGQCNHPVEMKRALGKGRGRSLKSKGSSEVFLNEAGTFHQDSQYTNEKMPSSPNNTISNATITFGQGTNTKNNTFVPEKENMHTNVDFTSSREHAGQCNHPVEPSSCDVGKVKKVRGRNKCKEVAALEVGEKLKLTFYNNRTVGKNSNVFSRHLGRLIRDRNMCPLGVSSWSDIKEENLNHMWAAIKDKFESDDLDSHREHILDWMKELWNKWRGKLHAKYVKGKTIQEALKNIPKGVDKKQWEWLVKEHFFSETFQARSIRNTVNRTKLKMPHRIGSKPFRQIIYEKGGKDGSPPDLATIFYETRMKGEKHVDSETIEKHRL